MENKKWYKVTFYAEMSDEDVKAMKGSFFVAMEEAMGLYNCEQLEIKEDSSNDDVEATYVQLREDEFELDEVGNLYIYKPKLNFKPKEYIDVHFMDEDDIIERYRMVSETDDKIKCEFVDVID